MPHLTIARRLRVVALLPVLAFIAAHWMPVFAADMQHIAHSPRAGIPDSARKATPADMHERPRYDIETTARVEAGGQARVRDVSESGLRLAKSPPLTVVATVVVTFAAGLSPPPTAPVQGLPSVSAPRPARNDFDIRVTIGS
jgi:hypothetical protein